MVGFVVEFQEVIYRRSQRQEVDRRWGQQKIIEIPQEYVDRTMPFYQTGKTTDESYLEMQSTQHQILVFIADKLERGDVNYNVLAEAFPLTNADAITAISQRLNLNSDETYFINADYPLCGSLPICHQGCGWITSW